MVSDFPDGSLAQKKPYAITRGKVIFDFSLMYCDTPAKLLQSELFTAILKGFIQRIETKQSRVFQFLTENVPLRRRESLTKYMTGLFRLLASHTASEIIIMNSQYYDVLSDTEYLLEFIEELYNYWRHFERFMYIEAPKRSHYTKQGIHHAQFIKLHVELKTIVLDTYRHVRENLLGINPRVYRQLPAGANMGILLEKIDWKCPDGLSFVRDVAFIRLAIMESPLILYPKMNTRKGAFKEIFDLKEDMLLLIPEQWMCYPAKIGTLTAFIYFHRDFISQGLSLCNLFEIAEYEDIEDKAPDIMMFAGLKNIDFSDETVFYEDNKTGILIGMIRHGEDIDYFGYFKKLPLTLHNIVMLERGRLPLHGAMTSLTVKSGTTAGVVIVGDSGAGKSETLEALRTLADEHIRDLKFIFDDMGSLNFDAEKGIAGYGTEIGAFVRLDDLQPGYAYAEIDRSIFMSPDKTNARLIIPITTYYDITRGYKVNVVLYANNYEQVDETHPVIEFFTSPEDALAVFRNGARYAKGTTDEKGIVNTYFANPFGAPQRREVHEELAIKYFNAMFSLGIKVGQIRTRLGVAGYGQEGPRAAAMELFEVIKGLKSTE
ncbi:phosphoenolpyruvate carboxykinase [Candidatus Magnetominusculus dajiuhuensis]|uniref:phosphoenolpyruvate carboxykinase n=1 Tax=Candidatus Magnetominusculus dajiuhuensis TaxID=3137712 RepID=UPI003B43C9E0